MTMKERMKKLLALVTTFMMLFTSMPVDALAEVLATEPELDTTPVVDVAAPVSPFAGARAAAEVPVKLEVWLTYGNMDDKSWAVPALDQTITLPVGTQIDASKVFAEGFFEEINVPSFKLMQENVPFRPQSLTVAQGGENTIKVCYKLYDEDAGGFAVKKIFFDPLYNPVNVSDTYTFQLKGKNIEYLPRNPQVIKDKNATDCTVSISGDTLTLTAMSVNAIRLNYLPVGQYTLTEQQSGFVSTVVKVDSSNEAIYTDPKQAGAYIDQNPGSNSVTVNVKAGLQGYDTGAERFLMGNVAMGTCLTLSKTGVADTNHVFAFELVATNITGSGTGIGNEIFTDAVLADLRAANPSLNFWLGGSRGTDTIYFSGVKSGVEYEINKLPEGTYTLTELGYYETEEDAANDRNFIQLRSEGSDYVEAPSIPNISVTNGKDYELVVNNGKAVTNNLTLTKKIIDVDGQPFAVTEDTTFNFIVSTLAWENSVGQTAGDSNYKITPQGAISVPVVVKAGASSGSVTINNIRATGTFNVMENDIPSSFTAVNNEGVSLEFPKEKEAIITNKSNPGQIQISKELYVAEGVPYVHETEETFEIELWSSKNTEEPYKTFEIVVPANASASAVTTIKVPAGSYYLVEKLTNDQKNIYGQESYYGPQGVLSAAKPFVVYPDSANAVFRVQNFLSIGNLTILKQLRDRDGYAIDLPHTNEPKLETTSFFFDVSSPALKSYIGKTIDDLPVEADGADNGKVRTQVSFVANTDDGVYERSVTIHGLPIGTYTVKESFLEADTRWKASYENGGVVTVTANATAQTTVTNTLGNRAVDIVKIWRCAGGDIPENGADIRLVLVRDGKETVYQATPINTPDDPTPDENTGVPTWEYKVYNVPAGYDHNEFKCYEYDGETRLEHGGYLPGKEGVYFEVSYYWFTNKDPANPGWNRITNYAMRDVRVTKEWVDNNNHDNKRPDHVMVQLYRDGVEYDDPVRLDATNSWTHVWEKLPDYSSAKDEKYVYTVKELDEEGNALADGATWVGDGEYKVTYPTPTINHDDRKLDAKVVNTHAADRATLYINKVIKDAEGNDYKLSAPETFRFIIRSDELKKGESYQTDTDNGSWVTVTNDGELAMTITVPKGANAKGTVIHSLKIGTYTVEEVTPDAKYTRTEIDTPTVILNDGDQPWVTVTNYLGQQTLKAKKVWDVAEGTQLPPDMLELVRLVRGEGDKAVTYTAEVLKIPATGNQYEWEYTFDVPAGYTYSVVEYDGDKALNAGETINVNGKDYTVAYDQATLTVTNSWKQQELTINKTIQDAWKNEYKLRERDETHIKAGWGAEEFTFKIWSNEEPSTINVGEVYGDCIVGLENDKPVLTMKMPVDVGESGGTLSVALPAGEYSVQEWRSSPQQTRYTVLMNGEDVTLAANTVTADLTAADATVEVINRLHSTTKQAFKVWLTKGAIPDQLELVLVLNGDLKHTYPMTWVSGTKTEDGMDHVQWNYEVEVSDGYDYKEYKVYELDESGNMVMPGSTVFYNHIEYMSHYYWDEHEITENNGWNQVYNVALVDVQVTKEWIDDKPAADHTEEIEVRLVKKDSDGKWVPVTGAENQKLTAPDWTATWDRLPLAEDYETQTRVEYAVQEVNAPAGYQVNFDIELKSGDDKLTYVCTLTNVKAGNISAKKVWDDDSDRDGVRPASVTYTLARKDGEPALDAAGNAVQTVTLNTSNAVAGNPNEWLLTNAWTNMPEYDENHNKIVYTVTETMADGDAYVYTADLTKAEATVGGTIEVTNKHAILMVSDPLVVTKKWVDENNVEGRRPDELKVNLSGGDQNFAYTMTAENATADDSNVWQLAISGIPANYNGAPINYQLDEERSRALLTERGYTMTREDAFTLVNTRSKEQAAVTVIKTWDDNENQDGMRVPIKVQINKVTGANSSVVVDQFELKENENWQHTFAGLAVYENNELIQYFVTETQIDGYTETTTAENKATFTLTDGATKTITLANKHIPYTTTIQVTKTWADVNNQDGKRPATISLTLTGTDGKNETVTVAAPVNGPAVVQTWSNLPVYKDGSPIQYTVKETAIDGYDTTGEEANFTTTPNGTKVVNITNTHTPATRDITVTKAWVDENNRDGKRPESITVRLFAGDAEVGSAEVRSAEITAADEWKHTFTDLPVYAGGQAITYTVTEDEVAEYDTTIDGFAITNTHNIIKTTVQGAKTWADNNNQDGIRPESITVNLLADGVKIDSQTVTADNNWGYTFSDLPVYAEGKQGVEIVYTVDEETVPGYEKAVNGFNIVNTHTPVTAKLTITKTWADNNNQDGKRPESITVQLNKGDTLFATATISENTDGKWVAEYTVPVYADGTALEYSIVEEAITETLGGKVITLYTTTYPVQSGSTEIKWNQDKTAYTVADIELSVTNTREPATFAIDVTKTWNDANNQDGKRPEVITVRLSANGEDLGTRNLTKADGWAAVKFGNLPVYKNGTPIIYRVTEDPVPEYTTTYTVGGVETNELTGLDANGKPAASKTVAIENAYATETANLTITKAWADANNQDGKRPATITVQLKANDDAVGEPVVWNVDKTAADNEAQEVVTFENLPVYKNGRKINYTVTENAVAEYTPTITPADGAELMANQTATFAIVNTHAVEKAKVSVSKTWTDSSNQDGKRPATITVRLFAGETEVGEKQMTAANDWADVVFDNLPVYANGQKIVYTVTEDEVAEYDAAITPADGQTLTANETAAFAIENKHETEKTKVIVTKAWDDADNQDGKRPEKITVNLFNGGDEPCATATVTENTDGLWIAEFSNLPVYANGQEITYTVTEDEVDWYSTAIAPASYVAQEEGVGEFTITNTHEPVTAKLTITKTWDDSNNQDGKRPESIKVYLNKGNDLYETAVISKNEDGAWVAEYTVPVYADGTALVYSIVEEAITETLGGEVITLYTTTYPVQSGSTAATLKADGTYTAADIALSVKNTRVPSKFAINVEKNWDDDKNQDGLRKTVSITLKANGRTIGTKTITAENGWAPVSFVDLAVYENGNAISYTVEEAAIAGYTTTYKVDGAAVGSPAALTGLDAAGKPVAEKTVEVTNYHKSGKTQFTVTKTWDDNENSENLRPESIIVVLKANGGDVTQQGIAAQQTLNAGNGWSYTWSDLDEKADGKPIEYTVEEIIDAELGYTPIITDTANGQNIRNRKDVPKLEVTKEVVNAKNADGAQHIFKLGETIQWKVTVTNTGNLTLKDVLVKDAMMPDGEETIDSLPIANTEGVDNYKVFTYSHKVTEKDLEKRSVYNQVVATAANPADPDGDPIEDTAETETPTDEPTPDIVIIAPDAVKDYDGDPLTNPLYTVPALENGVPGGEYVLPNGDILTATIGDNAATEDVAESMITNVGTVANVVISWKVTRDGEDVTDLYVENGKITTLPGTLEVRPLKVTIIAINDEKEYNGTPLTNDKYAVVAGEFHSENEIDRTKLSFSPDGVKIIKDETITATVTGSQTLVGKSNNVPSTATVEGGSNSNYAFFYMNGILEVKGDRSDLTKTDNEPENYQYEVQETAYYTITVSNYGDVDFPNTVVTEQTGNTMTAAVSNMPEGFTFTLNEDGTVLTIGTLRAGEVVVITAEHKVTEEDVLTIDHVYNNTVTLITDYPNANKEVSDNITLKPAQPALNVVKTAMNGDVPMDDDHEYILGETVRYKVVVTNVGDVTLHNVWLEDNRFPLTDEQKDIGTLLIGEENAAVIEYDYVVTEADLGGSIENTATATAPDPRPENDGETIEAEDTEIVVTDKKTGGIVIIAPNASKIYDSLKLENPLYTVELDGVELDGVPGGAYTLPNGDILTATIGDNAATTDVTESTITNAGTVANVVISWTVTRDGADVTALYNDNNKISKRDGKLEVLPRHVTVIADSKTKVYDGLALTDPDYAVLDGEVTAVPDGLEYNALPKSLTLYEAEAGAGQVEITASVAGSQTEVGFSPNTPSDALVNGEADEKNNYVFHYIEGTLKVTKLELALKIESIGNTWVYDGGEHVNYVYEVTVNGVAYAVTEKDGKYEAKLPTGDKVIITPKAEAAVTNVADTADENNTFEYVLEKAANYDITVEELVYGKLTITPRPVTIVADSDTAEYDSLNGESLTDPDYAVLDGKYEEGDTLPEDIVYDGEKAVVGDEIISATITGAQKYIGESANVPSEAAVEGGDEDNYEFYYINGLLKVIGDPIDLGKDDKEDDDHVYSVDDVIEYTITVTNRGDEPLVNVIVTEETGNRMVEVEGVEPDGYTIAEDGKTVVIAELVAGQVAVIKALHTVTEENVIEGEGEYVNTVSLNYPNKSIDKVVKVEPSEPGLSVTKEVVNELNPDGTKHIFKLGETIRWKVTVTNTGNLTLTDVLVKDDMMPDGEALIETLPTAKEGVNTKEFYYSYTVTEADLGTLEENGEVYNHVVATAENPDDPDGDPLEDDDETKTPTDTANPALEVTKTVTSTPKNGSTYALGETIAYQVVVKNVGNVTIKDITVTDTKLGEDWSMHIDELAPGAEAQPIQYEYKVVEADIQKGTVHNVATATAPNPVDPEAPDVTDDDDEDTDTDTKAPKLEVVKSVISTPKNGETYALGETIIYQVVVKNIGNVTIKDITVTDTKLGEDWSAHIDELAPGEKAEPIVYNYVVTEQDILDGNVHNVATATAPNPDDPDTPIMDEDDEDTPPDAKNPALEVVKTVISTPKNGETYALNEQITYQVTVQNVGNVTVRDITVTDTKLGEDWSAHIDELAPGEKAEPIVYNYVVTEQDILDGNVHNVATATAPNPDDPKTPITDEDDEDTPPDAKNPALKVVKTVISTPKNGETYALNEQITYQVTVQNVGNVTVRDITVTDTKLGKDWSMHIDELAPGEMAEPIVYNYTVTEDDILAGNVHNVATATAPNPDDPDTPITDEDDEDTPPDAKNPKLEVVKSVVSQPANGETYALGETIIYQVVVKNIGNVTVRDITVTDTKLGEDWSTHIDELAPGAEAQPIVYEYVVTEQDILDGNVHNVATATAPNPDDPDTPITDEDDEDTPPDAKNPELEVVKSVVSQPANGKTYALGETIIYQVVVKNIGNVTVRDITVTDTKLGEDWSAHIDELAPGAEAQPIKYEYVVTEQDILDGNVHNVATATAPNPDDPDNPITDEDDEDTPPDAKNPELDVIKSVISTPKNGETYALGETIIYQVVVKNIGNVTVRDITVTDTKLGKDWSMHIDELAPGEMAEPIVYNYTVTEDDILAGNVHNVATATAPNPDDPDTPITDEDDEDTPPDEINRSMKVDKTVLNPKPEGEKFGLGEIVYYEVVVTNDGNVSLHNAIVTDEKFPDGPKTIDVLRPGESKTFNYSYAVQLADMGANGVPGEVVNVVTVTTDDGPGGGDEERVPTKPVVYVTANDNTVDYDGKPHGENGAVLSGQPDGVELADVEIPFEAIDYGVYKNDLMPDNAKLNDADGNDVTDEYEIIYIPGTLIIRAPVTVYKKWENDNSFVRPEKILVALELDGEIIGDWEEMSEFTDWHATWFVDPSRIDELIVLEQNVSDDYTAIVWHCSEIEFILTNRYNDPQTRTFEGFPAGGVTAGNLGDCFE